MSLASQDLEKIVELSDESISAKAMLSAIMSEWKGPAGLAGELRGDYDLLSPGHPARVKLQTLIVQALLKFGDIGDDDDDLDPDVVEAELVDTLKRLRETDGDNP